MTILSEDRFEDVALAAADAMGRNRNQVILGYEAPWIKKIGNKVQTRYLDNQKSLDDLRAGFSSYLKARPKSKKNSFIEIFVKNTAADNDKAAVRFPVNPCRPLKLMKSVTCLY